MDEMDMDFEAEEVGEPEEGSIKEILRALLAEELPKLVSEMRAGGLKAKLSPAPVEPVVEAAPALDGPTDEDAAPGGVGEVPSDDPRPEDLEELLKKFGG